MYYWRFHSSFCIDARVEKFLYQVFCVLHVSATIGSMTIVVNSRSPRESSFPISLRCLQLQLDVDRVDQTNAMTVKDIEEATGPGHDNGTNASTKATIDPRRRQNTKPDPGLPLLEKPPLSRGLSSSHLPLTMVKSPTHHPPEPRLLHP